MVFPWASKGNNDFLGRLVPWYCFMGAIPGSSDSSLLLLPSQQICNHLIPWSRCLSPSIVQSYFHYLELTRGMGYRANYKSQRSFSHISNTLLCFIYPPERTQCPDPDPVFAQQCRFLPFPSFSTSPTGHVRSCVTTIWLQVTETVNSINT